MEGYMNQIELMIESDKGETLQAIIENARTGEVGDGKIFVSTLDNAIRIRTGEQGEDAI